MNQTVCTICEWPLGAPGRNPGADEARLIPLGGGKIYAFACLDGEACAERSVGLPLVVDLESIVHAAQP